MNQTEAPKAHPILGIVLGLLGIAAALALCLFTGMIGGMIAGALGFPLSCSAYPPGEATKVPAPSPPEHWPSGWPCCSPSAP